MNKMTVRDIGLSGKRVLVRVDFNVPQNLADGSISDDSRIRAAIPTIEYIQSQKARVILCSHLGRPDGKVVESMRLAPVARRLSGLLGIPVAVAGDCIGPEAEKAVAAMQPGDVLMLENLRFHAEEEKNDPGFAKALATLADVYVDDAFGTAHRAHASTEGVAHILPAVAGFLMEKELNFLSKALADPQRPFAAIIGGAKVSDKMGFLTNIQSKVDYLMIGGGMCCTFLKAQGYKVGRSLVEDDRLDFAKSLMEKAVQRKAKLLLPTDVVVAGKFDKDASSRVVSIKEIPEGWLVLDIGPDTVKTFAKELMKCRTVLWNGPLGVFEFPAFRKGTEGVARTLAELEAATILGGGSTAEAAAELGVADKMTHVSTGGGATLQLLEGKPMPGVEILMDKGG